MGVRRLERRKYIYIVIFLSRSVYIMFYIIIIIDRFNQIKKFIVNYGHFLSIYVIKAWKYFGLKERNVLKQTFSMLSVKSVLKLLSVN